MKLFAQIRKVDEEKRMVYGRAAQEVVDRSKEIFDYAKSKPYFQEWSKSFSDATDGKSQGNVRAMHGKVSAGIVKEIDFADVDKAIDIATYINDDQEWKKVLDGNYTGFSIGGSYVGDLITEKIDGVDVKRYVANPSEISIVDSPCIPTARFFEIVKAGGAIEKVEFKPPQVEVVGSDDDVLRFGEALNSVGMPLAKAIEMVESEAMLDTLDDMTKREFSSDERKSAAKEGAALPDGSFPIKSKGDLSNAIRAYGRAKNKAAAKRHIIKRAKALDAIDMLPKDWGKVDDKGDLAKSMFNVGRFAETLSSLASIAASAQDDFDWEGDDSPVPMLLRNWLGDGVDIFKTMADEESIEMLTRLKTQASVGLDDEIEIAVQAAYKVGTLRKMLADPELSLEALTKIAKEYSEPLNAKVLSDLPALTKRILDKAMSTANMDRLQAAHDHLVGIGAACSAEKSKPADVTKLASDDVQKLVNELTAKVAKLEAQPVPHVIVRAMTKAYEKPRDPSEVTTIATKGLDDGVQKRIEEKGYAWCVKFADGTVNWAESAQKLTQEEQQGASA